MQTEITIDIQKINRKSIIVPETITLSLESSKVSAKQLISAIVTHYVHQYNDKHDSPVIQLLTPQIIESSAEKGKVQNEAKKHVVLDVNTVVNDTLQGFSDQLFLMFINDAAIASPDQEIELTKTVKITFIKLIMLSGTWW
jgi:lipopolysaccharide export system protein LptC